MNAITRMLPWTRDEGGQGTTSDQRSNGEEEPGEESYEQTIQNVDPGAGGNETSVPRAVSNGRRQEQAMFNDLVKSREFMMTVAFFQAIALVIAVGAAVYFAAYTRVERVVVEKDITGRYLSARPIDGGDISTPEASRRLGLASFIRDIRRSTPDKVVQREYKNRAFAYATEEVEAYIRSHFRSHPSDDPFQMGGKLQREAVINAVSKIPDSGTPALYKVEWTENTRNLQGAMLQKEPWEAYVRMTQGDPQNQTDARYNLMGIYITSLDWSSRNGPAGYRSSGAGASGPFPGATSSRRGQPSNERPPPAAGTPSAHKQPSGNQSEVAQSTAPDNTGEANAEEGRARRIPPEQRQQKDGQAASRDSTF